jgi:two-component system, chemotaxis family, sensor histidine kinase and response regulator PixL
MLTSDSDIRDQAYQFFIQEAVEFLQTLETGLINLSQEHSIPKVHELMRSAHSIKGGAASVGLMGIQQLAHQLEDCLRALYHEEVVIDTILEDLLLQAYDCLRIPLEAQIETGQHDAEQALLRSEPIFAQLVELLGDAMQGDAAMPTTAELGIDIVLAIFSGDVSDGLNRLAEVLANPNSQELVGEIRAQTEVFVGIGELVNLPGWVAIAKAILTALQYNPEQAYEMGLVALKDLQTAQQMILAGDRKQGGEPSAELLQYAEASALINTPTLAGNLFDLSVDAPSHDSMDSWQIAESFSGEDFDTLDAFFDSALTDSDLASIDNPAIEDHVIGLSASESAPEHGTSEDWQTFSKIADELTGELTGELTDDRSELLSSQVSRQNDWEELETSAPSLDTAIRNLIQADSESEMLEPQSEESIQLEDLSEKNISEIEVNPSIDTVIRELLQKAEETESSLAQLAASMTGPEIGSVHSIDLPPEPQFTNAGPKAPTVKPEPDATPAPTSNTVRVDLSRLERINNLVGELVTQENRIILQNQQLQSVIKTMTQRFGEFETVAKQIGQWSDQTQKEYAKLSDRRDSLSPNQGRSNVESLLAEALGEDFDPLQMDSYSELYEQAQEMLELIAQMNEGMRDITAITHQAQQNQRQQQQILKQIREDLLWARMLPLSDLMQRFPRMLRDLSARHGKQVNLKLTGAQTLVDKSILQSLYDPLVHLLRNAFDHGVESPDQRIAQGKPAQATIEISAYHRGNQTYIEIRDDGQGINPEKIRSQIVAQNLLSRQEVNGLTIEELYNYLFVPGFSTAQQVSELSGRGVGLDAVQLQVHNLKGSVSVSSQPGEGTTFTLRLPLTLTIANLLVFSIQSYLMALPMDSLQAIVSASPNQIRTLRGERILQWEDELIPLYPAQTFLQHYPLPNKNLPEQFRAIPLNQGEQVSMLILALGNQLIALQVDQILQEQELAIKPFNHILPQPQHFYGCTILGNGLF